MPLTPAPPTPGMPSNVLLVASASSELPFARSCFSLFWIITQASTHAHTAPASPSNNENGLSGVRNGDGTPCWQRGGSCVENTSIAKARDRHLSASIGLTRDEISLIDLNIKGYKRLTLSGSERVIVKSRRCQIVHGICLFPFLVSPLSIWPQ